MTLSIELISCDVVETQSAKALHETDLVQDVDHIPQRPLNTISAFIPVPVAEEVVIDRLIINQYMLAELRRVVVGEVAESINGLGDCRSEGCVRLRELLRECDKGL